ncbi:MAG: ribonuclease E/G, partial [Nocardioidaceae bacterium]
AEEIVRQLRLRDIGGIIVVDFIDMVLESNRDLVLRRLVECLGRDRTRHQVAEVTSLGLVQMTRKRIGTGLLEAFSHTCEHCQGRGVIVFHEPVEARKKSDDEPRRSRRNRGRRSDEPVPVPSPPRPPSPADLAALPRHEQPQPETPEPAVEPETVAVDVSGTTVEVVSAPAAEGQRESVTEPVVAPDPVEIAEAAELEAVESEPVEPPAPRIVTSVRRVSARRAAGPPAAPAAESLPPLVLDDEPFELIDTHAPDPESGDPEPGGVGMADEHASNGVAAHVPIKRKGSRKR